ncbi:MAG: NPXTG-anchored protein [Oscillospiraceae bacterium]|nr:NPXTG-anchored protein [Oscillospiraceae bacterium]
MKIWRKVGAAIVAAAVAVSTLAVSSFAEQAEDNLLSLITAEIPTEFDASIIYVEGVGLLDISGEIFDSSENGYADEDANLDIDFNGLGYVSEKNLEAWRETGVLTFSKLRADFDTTGLQWGMFDHSSEYVQLVRRDDEGKVTERAVYKITDGEIKKLYDLDTFWTSTRYDGVSVGFERILDTFHLVEIREDYETGETTPYESDRNYFVELKMVVTQTDGTKTETVVAKASMADMTDKTITGDVRTGYYNDIDGLYYFSNWSYFVKHSGDVLAYASVVLDDSFFGLNLAAGFEVYRCNSNGTVDTVFEADDSHSAGAYGYARWVNGTTYWYEGLPVTMNWDRICFFNEETKKIESVEFDREGLFYFDPYAITDKIIGEPYSYDYDLYERINRGYAIFDDLEDLKNFESKTYYKKITAYSVGGTYIYMFEDLNGKVGYMDGNENVLAYFDDIGGFAGNYAPAVKGGKAFLVDRYMNTVSEEIEADGVTAINDELFIISKGGKYYFVTYNVEVEDPATGAVMVDYSDDASGIKASAESGVLEEGAQLIVAAVADKTNANTFTYNIYFKVGDREVQPNGTVTVKIPVPETLTDKTIYVYRAETNGSYTPLAYEVVDGYIVFKTNHFSEYIVTSEPIYVDNDDDDDDSSSYNSNNSNNSDNGNVKNPDTGFAGFSLAIGLVALAGAAVVVSRKK